MFPPFLSHLVFVALLSYYSISDLPGLRLSRGFLLVPSLFDVAFNPCLSRLFIFSSALLYLADCPVVPVLFFLFITSSLQLPRTSLFNPSFVSRRRFSLFIIHFVFPICPISCRLFPALSSFIVAYFTPIFLFLLSGLFFLYYQDDILLSLAFLLIYFSFYLVCIIIFLLLFSLLYLSPTFTFFYISTAFPAPLFLFFLFYLLFAFSISSYFLLFSVHCSLSTVGLLLSCCSSFLLLRLFIIFSPSCSSSFLLFLLSCSPLFACCS